MTSNADIDSIFCEAVEIASDDEREEYLQQACGADAELRARIDKLLAAHLQAGSFMPEGDARTLDLPNERPGSHIGPYNLRERLGEGGMGVVWAAEQKQPLRRKVALKVIKPGMDSEQVIARFGAEREALSLMDHSNIARVLDAGATDQGRPYFVMELIRGVPITDYCDANQLPIPDRLSLFVQVCRAVQHAHQKGIIHRDIKPSNVLVSEQDGRAIAKVIDFGVAKALHHAIADYSMYTGVFQAIGTLAYMSPEQAGLSTSDIDTRADVYGLGVLLYELLTGDTPFNKNELASASLDEACRIIREKEPPRPSTKIGTLGERTVTVSANRGTDPKSLGRMVRGDLDWIAMKAMDKDRNLRYETAEALARDVERHLNHEIIEARRPSLTGRLRKFARRHPSQVAIALTLLVAAVIAPVMWLEISRVYDERSKAQLEAEKLGDQRTREEKARNKDIPDIKLSLRTGYRVAAFRRMKETRDVLRDDPLLETLWSENTATVTIETTPANANVLLRDLHGPPANWFVLGDTPLKQIEVPKGKVQWKFELHGHQPVERMADFSTSERQLIVLDAESPKIVGMVRVEKGAGPRWVSMTVAERESLIPEDFFIDSFEVTNAQYAQFVSSGYEKEEIWDELMADYPDSWKNVLSRFVDRTGKPGPALWSDGSHPPEEGDHPVTGVSWYEACAYARSIGKSVPTIHHWGRAANFSDAKEIAVQGNYGSSGTLPVGSSGVTGYFGVSDMAGNVKEWCWNRAGDESHYAMGGAWSDPVHMFASTETFDPLARDETIGFRCVWHVRRPPNESFARVRKDIRNFSTEVPVSRDRFEDFKRLYLYDHNAALSAKRLNESRLEWGRHEVVEFDAAYGDQRLKLHMLLPDIRDRVHPVLLYFPGLGATWVDSYDPLQPDWGNDIVAEFVRQGWVVAWPTYDGTFERSEGFDLHELRWNQPYEYRKYVVRWVQDAGRTIDFLATRSDVDLNTLSYLGTSWGGAIGPVMVGAEDRFKAAVFIAGGLYCEKIPDDVDAFNYAPHVGQPVLMINGCFDRVFPLLSSQEPLFQGLGARSENKQHVVLDGLHAMQPVDEPVGIAVRWLQQHLNL